ncbi:MAG: SurA N-terminal domain-containing protein, partial [Anaerolineales bacterium]|nr:SurA N-terminal domain-containing protein [Anaerolineales bacterium]
MFSKPQLLYKFLILILALGLSACAPLFAPASTPTPLIPTATPIPPTATPPPSVAVVNGEYILIPEFQSELDRYKTAQTALGKTVADEDANRIVLEDMVAQVLLAQSARAENFEVTESDLKSRIDALGSSDSL